MESRWRRATEISSKLIGPHGIPVTPLINPRSGHSYHVINVIDDWKAGYAVDVLIRDVDAYIVAFRRQLLVEGKWYPGTWYRYTDVIDLPKDIEDNAVDLGFKSSHGDSDETKPGGIYIMHDMFEVLSGFEDCGRDKKGRLIDPTDNQRVKEALLKAIVIFGEAFRFRSIYLAVRARIQDDEGSSELDGSLWILLHDWGLFSSELLLQCNQGPLPALHTAAPAPFHNIRVRRPGSHELRALNTLDDVVGALGEMMLVKAIPNLIASFEERTQLNKILMKRNAEPVAEPGFQHPELPPQPDAE
ncbi:uncharacterized protein [Miscanthus floridulus]|uniref:uncharacterized protein n=1 Tax=Miscanthus floridulus TaxID=154761 RepID=UPI003458CE74